jgi:hypothetical protein
MYKIFRRTYKNLMLAIKKGFQFYLKPSVTSVKARIRNAPILIRPEFSALSLPRRLVGVKLARAETGARQSARPPQ